jgi:hypothetical protein
MAKTQRLWAYTARGIFGASRYIFLGRFVSGNLLWRQRTQAGAGSWEREHIPKETFTASRMQNDLPFTTDEFSHLKDCRIASDTGLCSYTRARTHDNVPA